MSVCPNRNAPEWKALVAGVGEFEAYRDFMEYNGEIRSPRQVAHKLAVRARNLPENYQKERTSSEGTPVAVDTLENLAKDLAAKFGDEYGYRLVNDPKLPWKGKVEPPSQANEGKRTVVINSAKATLDTPIHEFGHIFLDMIKNENPRLYAELSRTVPKSQEGRAELAIIKKLYPELTEQEAIEETIVELMGQHGAGHLSEKSKLGKLLQELWENIKAYIKDMISKNNEHVIEAVAIKYNTPIDVLAQILTIKDLKIEAGLEIKAERENMREDAMARIQEAKTQLEIMDSLEIDNPDQVEDPDSLVSYKVQGKMHAITRATASRLDRITEAWANIKDYVSEENLMNETTKAVKALKSMSSQLNSAEKIAELKKDSQFDQWFFILRADSSLESRLQNLLDNQTNERVIIDSMYMDIFNEIAELAYYTSESAISKILTQSHLGLSNMFPKIEPSEYYTHAGVANVMADVRDQWEERLARTQLELDENGGMRSEMYSEFEIEVVDNKLGQKETDKITLQIKFQAEHGKPSVYVSFNSDKWGYGDPVWLTTFNAKIAKKDDRVVFKPLDEYGKGTGKEVYSRPYGKVHDVTPDGSVIVKMRTLADWQRSDYADYFEMVDPEQRLIKVKPEKLDLAINQSSRMTMVMAKVMDEIGRLGYGYNYEYITFAAATSQWGGKGRMRHGVYQSAAERMFGKNYALLGSNGQVLTYEELENQAREKWIAEGNNPEKFRFSVARQVKEGSLNNVEYDLNTIVFPKTYRDGLFVQKEVYQKERQDGQVPEGTQDSLLGLSTDQNPMKNTEPMSPDQNNRTRALEVARKLSDQLGIEYEMITSQQAMEVTANTTNPWNGQPAFFVGGKVYFVGDKLDTDLVFHEFAHPLLRAIQMENRALFDNLFEQLAKTDEGQVLIQEALREYPNHTAEDNIVKEEALAKALGKAAADKLDGFKTETKFARFIKELMYALKQLLRGKFGQNIKISKLSPSTSLNSLAETLAEGSQFEIETEHISQEDVVAYMDDHTRYIDDLLNIKGAEILGLLQKAYNASAHQLDTLIRQKKYAELADLLTDQYERGDLQEIKRGTAAFQNAVMNAAKEAKDSDAHLRNQASSLVNVIFRLEKIMDKINRHVQDLMTDEERDSVENLKKLTYYESVVDYWAQFIDEAKVAINQNNIPYDSSIVQSVNGIGTLVDRFNAMKDEVFSEGARDALYETLEPMGRDLKKRYETIIANLKERGAPQKTIDKWHKEYYGMTEEEYKTLSKLRADRRAGKLRPSEQAKYDSLMLKNAQGIELTPEKLEGLLQGKMGDANFFNSYLEGYLYNTDPVIGGLALYVKNHLNQVMITSQQKFQDFKRDMQPLMDAIGVNPHNIGEFGKMMGNEDLVGKKNYETGEIEERKVWTLLSKHKNYRLDLARLRDAVEKAEADYMASGSEADRKALIDAVNERKQMHKDYMHQEYVPEFYARESVLIKNENDTVGQEASYRRASIFERMNALTDSVKTEDDNLAIMPKIDALWAEYRQLHSLYTIDGQKKTGLELEIAKRLRTYREASRQFYEDKLRKGVFENALANFEQSLVEQGVTDPEIFAAARQEWIKKNTVTSIKKEWYDYRARLMKKIKDILSKLPDAERKEIDQSGEYEKIIDVTSPFKDNDGQTRATEMSTESLASIKEAEETIIEKKKKYRGRSGLTPAQSERLSELHAIDREERTDAENREMAQIYADKNKFGLSESEILELDTYYAELESLSRREATDYYVDVMNGWLTLLDTSVMEQRYKTNSITPESASALLEKDVINSLLGQNEEFDKWFEANHILKEFYNKDKEPAGMDTRWERIRAWSIVRPSDSSFYETHEFVNSEGELETVGKPGRQYYVRVVKPEFRTERIVGETVDNQGQWLPKTVEQGAKDGKYRNDRYYEMAENEPDKFKALQMLTKWHLANQEGLSYKNRLYLDFPRFRKSNLETLQTRNVAGEKMNAITIWAKRVKEFWTGAKDDPESGFNYDEDEVNLVRADMFDNEITGVPIAGLYDIDFKDTSTDITYIMMRYMLSAERQKQLVAISPVAKAVQKVVNHPDHEVKDLTKKHRFNLVHRGITTYLNKKGMKVRQSAVNNFMEREFEGKTMKGIETPWLNNAANKLFGRASFGFFAFNIPSALKNSFGAKFQGMIEAAAGKYMNARSFAAGDVLAGKVMMEISNQVYRRTNKSLHVQMTEIFDFSQGRFEDPQKFGEDLSRTITQDVAGLSWFYNFRKWVELQATFQIGFGMMKYQKITLDDGSIVNYDEVWEVRDGKIQLKDGVPAEWGITYDENGEMQVGAEFMRFKNRMQQVMNNLQGAYAKFDQPEAQRYLAFRFVSYLRRYFTTMTMNRWGYSGKFWNAKPRMNPGLGDVQRGFYVTFLNTLKDTITQVGGNLPYMSKDEKQAAIRVITEIGALILLNLMMGLLFGWDPDDEDRFKKLREKSGALPFPFVSDQPGREFNGWGYLENHALLLMMNIQAENEQFLPFPGAGLDDYTAMLDLKSIVFGPTVKTYRQIIEDIYDIAIGDERAYYKRDVGPYDWQREGSAKIWAHLGRTVGITGSSLDPQKAIKGLQTSKSMSRAR